MFLGSTRSDLKYSGARGLGGTISLLGQGQTCGSEEGQGRVAGKASGV